MAKRVQNNKGKYCTSFVKTIIMNNCLQMYSGYYQHEIETNLLNADSLFIAMGYTKCSNDTLVLNGPICLDQVCNVSRDCMSAYVECQVNNVFFFIVKLLLISFGILDND